MPILRHELQEHADSAVERRPHLRRPQPFRRAGTPFDALHEQVIAWKFTYGSEILLRADLAADIRSWLADRLTRAQQAACDADEPIPATLSNDEPDGLIRIFDRDLVFAGLARVENRGGKEVVVKTDDRGRTIDIHALRHTFGTHLSKAGVPLRTAQAALRHSDPSLTANVYTDPKLLDVAGAVASLPDLPLGVVRPTATAVANSSY